MITRTVYYFKISKIWKLLIALLSQPDIFDWKKFTDREQYTKPI